MMSSALRFFFDRFISCIARTMASKSAVRPFDCANVSSFWISSKSLVSGVTSFTWSLNSTRKNSSSGLVVWKNAAAARRERRILGPMLPLVSKTRPTATGSSSIAKWVMFCSAWSSKILKCSGSRPVTGRLFGSVTETGMSTRLESTRRVAFGAGGSALAGFGRG